MRIEYIETPLKNYVPAAGRACARPIAIRQLGIQKTVVVRTKGNGGVA